VTKIMKYAHPPELAPDKMDEVVRRYVAVWNEPDPGLRRDAVAGLWAEDGAQFVESAQFCGREELEARVAGAYKEFVESGGFTVASADDAVGHHDAVTFTIQLISGSGGVAWAARVVLIVGADYLIRSDYQFTVVALATD
jgi:hypothetical protein